MNNPGLFPYILVGSPILLMSIYALRKASLIQLFRIMVIIILLSIFVLWVAQHLYGDWLKILTLQKGSKSTGAIAILYALLGGICIRLFLIFIKWPIGFIQKRRQNRQKTGSDKKRTENRARE